MEKVTLFFCDICGTFDCGSLLRVNNYELIRFIHNLKKIIKHNGSNKIIFSFVTTEDFNTVTLMDKNLRLYIDDSICIGKHFYNTETKSVNKANDIIRYIQELKLMYFINQDIYYADDCEFYHCFLKELNDDFQLGYTIKSIIPKNGLVDVNNILENSLNEINKTKTYYKSIGKV